MGRNERDGEGFAPGEGDELKVKDRRLFTADGQLRQELEEEDDAREEPRAERFEPSARSSVGRDRGDAADASGFEHRPIEEPRGVDFTMLLNAMVQPALIFLGEIPHPGTGKPEVNVEQAQIQIDLLDLLRVKCRGNLSAEEEGLLDRMLYQLRMLYVAQSQKSPGV